MDTVDRILELENAIRKHRDQRLDDRCFLDDQELYKILNEPIPEDYNDVPPFNKMLKNCERFLKQRCNPNEKWSSYQELEEELAKANNRIEELEGHIDNLNSKLSDYEYNRQKLKKYKFNKQ